MRPITGLTVVATCLLAAATASAGALPGVDTKGLDEAELSALTQLLDEGACPCDPKLSLKACVEAKSCAKATTLAAFGADKFREGMGIEEVREAVVKKYISDNLTFTFELKDTPKKGAENGKITIVEFADFECPHCAMMRKVLDRVVKAHPETVTVYFKQFPIAFHQYAEKAARATLAAHRQGRFWQMHDIVFANQGKLTDESFVAFATELGMNVEKFKKDMADPAIARQVQRDKQEGMDANLSGTPTLFINGKLYLEDKTFEALDKHIKSLLKK